MILRISLWQNRHLAPGRKECMIKTYTQLVYIVLVYSQVMMKLSQNAANYKLRTLEKYSPCMIHNYYSILLRSFPAFVLFNSSLVFVRQWNGMDDLDGQEKLNLLRTLRLAAYNMRLLCNVLSSLYKVPNIILLISNSSHGHRVAHVRDDGDSDNRHWVCSWWLVTLSWFYFTGGSERQSCWLYY